MTTLHDKDVGRRESLVVPTDEQMDALIPDLTDVDIHEHIPELGGPGSRRAATKVRWLNWLAAFSVIAVLGAVAALLVARATDQGVTVEEFAALEDAVAPTARAAPGVSVTEFAALEDAVTSVAVPVRGVSAAEFAALEDAVVATIAREHPTSGVATAPDLPGIPAITTTGGVSVAEFAALEDAVSPVVVTMPGVSAAEFAALEDAVTPRS